MRRKLPHILLSLFVTFLVMNVVTFDANIFLVGKYGKLVLASIGIVLLEKDLKGFFFFVRKNILIVLFWILCLLFTGNRILSEGMNTELLQSNVLFIFFIYFCYLLVTSFKKVYHNPAYHFFKTLANTLTINFVFWTLVALLLSLELWHTLEDRTGLGMFYGSYVQFGIFSCVAAVTHFMVVKFTSVKKSKMYFVLFLFYACLVVLTNSRNAQIITLLVVLLSFLPYLKKVALRNIYIIVLALLLVGINLFSQGFLLDDNVSQVTTGRNWIWYYVFEHYQTNSVFLGEGIFGLNDTILNENISSNYYFQRLDFLYFHSSYIEVFSAAGLLGLIFFVLYIMKSLKERKNLDLVVLLIAIVAGGFFESFLVQPTILTSFLFWCLIVQTPKIEKKVIVKSNPVI